MQSKSKQSSLQADKEQILQALSETKAELEAARMGFSSATDDALIDSYIYQIIALNKKYDYFLQSAKKLGLRASLPTREEVRKEERTP